MCVVVVAMAAGLVALVLGGGAPQPVPAGLPDAGRLVAWGLAATRAAGDLAAALTVGSILVPALLDTRPSLGRTYRVTACAAALWSAAAAADWVLTACDRAGVPVSGLDLAMLATWGGSGRVLVPGIVALVVALLAVVSLRQRSARGSRVLLAAALVAAVPLPVLGHTGAADDAGMAVSGLVVHVVAALLWTGGLAGLLIHLRHDQAGLALAAPRFSALALAAYVALGGSGVLALTAVLPLSGPGLAAAWTSGYAGVVLAKLGLLVVLGVLGHWHRRRTLPLLAAGRRGALVRLASAELMVMGAAMGLAAALAVTPGPVVPLDGTGHGHSDLGPISVTGLLVAWRPNAVVIVVLALALAAYLRGARRLTSDGIWWPAHRSASFAAGLLVALVLTCSGVALWAPLLLSVHAAQLLLALLVVPLLLLLGRPIALARALGRSTGATAPLGISTGAVTGSVATCVLLVGVFRTPAVELSLRSPWWHLLLLALAVLCGTALLSPVLGTDVGDARRETVERSGSLLVVAACLGLLALQLTLGDRLLAGGWFRELRLGWVDPLDDQRLAGLLVAGAAIGLVVLAVLVLAAGRRSSVTSDR